MTRKICDAEEFQWRIKREVLHPTPLIESFIFNTGHSCFAILATYNPPPPLLLDVKSTNLGSILPFGPSVKFLQLLNVGDSSWQYGGWSCPAFI